MDDCACGNSEPMVAGGGQQGYLMDESCPSFVISPEAARYPGANQTYRASSPGSPRGYIMNETYTGLVSGSPVGSGYPGDQTYNIYGSGSPNFPGDVINETCPSLAFGSPSPMGARYNVATPPKRLGPKYLGYIMDESSPGLVGDSPVDSRYHSYLMNETPPSLVGSSQMGPRYHSHLMNETPPSYLASSPVGARYHSHLMNETPPSLIASSPEGPRYHSHLMNETPPNLVASSPGGPRYHSHLMNETPPSLIDSSPGGPRYHSHLMKETPPSLAPGSQIYPSYLINESCPTFASGGPADFSSNAGQRSPARYGVNLQRSALPPGTPDLFGASGGSDFLVSAGFDIQSWPQISGGPMSTPTDSFLVSGSGTPSPQRAAKVRRETPTSSPQAHSRNQIALPSDVEPPCPCPDEKIKSIAKRSFTPASIKEARNNITESIESHLKKEEPLEFNAVVNSVKNYQALRRQVISGHGPPKDVEDVGPYASFHGGMSSKKASSPQGCPASRHR
ncbi:nascent polypeptide-associated complex subunit alpha, muscle-specific form-like [Coccinella septempunctata]|uniref:nascent polypeptide-associated complex subunit alpha, muscle-specific form-like n=1 Tax=Coccinella septempunctata TaxID=41139 RepID=UPI001D06C5DE|nr:nascent polypeptide-associated complex subunit alpha, muscle-specific form-like [Coccinella septempunctata]